MPLPDFAPWQWALLFLGAFCVGLSKTGVPGLGVLFVAVFSNLLGAKQATGIVLPLLIVGDVFAVAAYHRHLVWAHLWKLFPWTIAGVLLGWLALGQLDNLWTNRLVGALLFILLAVHQWRRRLSPEKTAETFGHAPLWVATGTGVLAGFCTMVANAAGAVMSLYLLAMRLGKMEFMGTSAVFFLLLNWFKVPFMMNLGMIDPASLRLNLLLAPAVVIGAFAGRRLLAKINQEHFEAITLILTLLAAAKLLYG